MSNITTFTNNGDPSFNVFLDKYNLNTPEKRRFLFYNVCIFVRLALYSLVFYYRDNKWMPYILSILSIFTIYNLYQKLDQQQQWWSIKFQFVISILLLTASILVLLKKIPTISMPIILYTSLIGGLAQSFFIEFK